MSKINFNDLIKNREQSNKDLKEALKKLDNKQQTFEKEVDTRLWDLNLDETGMAYALIRFLPSNEENVIPPVKTISFGFQGPILADGSSKWYWENSLRTIGQDDPAQKYINSLYAKTKATGDKRYEEQAKTLKKNTNYYANILVLDDPAHPENNGKVFIYKFPKSVFDKIMSKQFPEFKDETAVNVFDFLEGANFKMKLTAKKTKIGGKDVTYRNYEKCEFDSTSALFNGDLKKIEAVYEQQYNLSEFIAPSEFKSYSELLKRLEQVLGVKPGKLFQDEISEEDEQRYQDAKEDLKELSKPKTAEKEPTKVVEKEAVEDTPHWEEKESADDAEELEFFKKLGG